MPRLRQRDVLHKAFSKFSIKLLSSDEVLKTSKGEVTKAETVNYRTYKPERDGLFCERIFGPQKDWECSCGKYRGSRYKGIVCDKCNVEVNRRSVRRERIGHIKLAVPVVHIWFFRSLPSKIGNLLDYTVKTLEQIIYYEKYVVIKPGKIVEDYQLLIERYNKSYLEKYHKFITELEKLLYLSIKDDSQKEATNVVLKEFYGNFEENDHTKKVYTRLSERVNEIEDMIERFVADKYREKDIRERIYSILYDDYDFMQILAEFVDHDKDIRSIPVKDKKDVLIFDKLIRDVVNLKFVSTVKDLKYKSLMSESDYNSLIEKVELYENEYSSYDQFKAEIGAEAVRLLLKDTDIKQLSAEMRKKIEEETSEQNKQDILKKLNVVESFKNNMETNKPEYMVLDVIPVIPPELRPLVPLEGGRFATSDLNDLYRRVIIRNKRLKKMLEIKAPEVIVRNEKRMIQEAVDSLFDNGRKNNVVRSDGKRALKSLSDSLKGKQGRFRSNLLGKRVDYSCRSVIVVGPQLKLHQCGLPKEMALELYKPYLIRKLIEYDPNVTTIKNAKKEIEKGTDKVWELLENLVDGHPVLLNRAPTLHRLGIQAFQPVLIEGKAIQLHPLVCKAFNADFDGDQMAVHLPLSPEAKLEARLLMMASHNLLHPATGRSIAYPTQDMVLGIYYMTKRNAERDKNPKIFSNIDEIKLALDFGAISYHSDIKYFFRGDFIDTTPGMILFNEVLPQELTKSKFYNETMISSKVEKIIEEAIEKVGFSKTALFLDRLKDFGYKYATKSGISIGLDDFVISPLKDKVLRSSEKKIELIKESYDEGQITDTERYNKVVDEWTKATNKIEQDMYDNLRLDKGGFNPVFMMMDSKARGSRTQIKQICGIRGLMQKPQKNIEVSSDSVIENPIKTNFIDGLSILDYFISTHGGRKGLADTALKTADAGYLTRKLVDVAHDVVVTEEDCHTIMGIDISDLKEGDKVLENFEDRIYGRVLAEDVVDFSENPDGEIICEAGTLIDRVIAKKIVNHNVEKVKIRSVLTCESKKGICAKCYGQNLTTRNLVSIGEAVGIMAAQSIGEPGTQLTLRTFHVGGSADIATIKSEEFAKYDGIIELVDVETVNYEKSHIVIRRNGVLRLIDEFGKEVMSEKLPYSATLLVSDKEKVTKGQILFKWDPYSYVILSQKNGKVKFKDIVEGSTFKTEVDDKVGLKYKVMIEPKERSLKPTIFIVDKNGNEIAKYLPPSGGALQIDDGDKVKAGQILIKMQRSQGKTKDITGGLPRVSELFEARDPKDPAILSEIDGVVKYGDFKGTSQIIMVEDLNGNEVRTYNVPRGKHILVHDGDIIYAGEKLTEGSIKPDDILQILGTTKVQHFLVNQIQEVYRGSGVNPNDKHIEVIVRQMLQKVQIVNPGDTSFLEGDKVSKFVLSKNNSEIYDKVIITDTGDSKFETGEMLITYEVENRNKKLSEEGKKQIVFRPARPATYKPLLLGITEAALQVDSFISAASFQETTKVLTDAAIKSSTDYLEGLKENVIMGNLLPCGTGLAKYNYITVKNKFEEESVEEEPEEDGYRN
ncbi:MAG TPA: DNA-directed RNA polymerase subunit beta' [Clostridiales bacterium]|nr:DNA-directed RNA polymerase subunit beta' [Clostridiales bacterium]HQP68797.1 DNA-directed RNA polymerase subunit beta' [Clostridiales bacterium]